MNWIKRILKFFFIAVFFITLGYLIGKPSVKLSTFNNSTKESISKDAVNYFRESAWGDFNGDGKEEEIIAFSKDNFFKNNTSGTGFIAAYDEQGNEIARTSEDFIPEWSTLPGHMMVYQLDKNSKKEYLRLRRTFGTHNFLDMFMTIENKTIIPICKVEAPNDVNDCIFNNSSYDQGVFRDLDKDGYIEATEIVDEYPEGGGRGRPVAAGIYKFNGKYFESQNGQSYGKLFTLLVNELKGMSLIMSSSWSEEGKRNFEEVQNLWKGIK